MRVGRTFFIALALSLISCAGEDQKARRFAPEIFEDLETFALTMEPDGETLYVTAALRDGGGFYKSDRVDNKWQSLQKIPFSSGEFNDNDLFPSPDGSREYFFMTRRGDLEKPQNIWVVKKDGAEWGEMYEVDAVNSDQRDGFPSVSLNGDLYFFSHRAGGVGAADIYVSKKVDGSYAEPVNLGAPINSKYWDGLPYISPNGRVLIFFSDRPKGYGGGDLYASYLVDGKWLEPENLGGNVNSEATEVTPFIGPDRKHLYFARVEADDSTHRRSIYYIALKDTPIKQHFLRSD